MKANHVSILGVGLLGGSIGLAIRSRLSKWHVSGYGHRQATVDAALQIGALHEGYVSLAPAVKDAGLVILCTPVGLFRPLLAELAPLLAPGTIVTDVGSTSDIVKAAETLLPEGVHFVGSHPMAGSEKRGVQHAKADLYEGALCILTPTANTSPQALEAVKQFWADLGMRTCQISPEEHDRRLADVSHLPHAVAAALMSLQDEDSIALAGKGFYDMTRIAGGDGALWRDIFLDNRDNLRQSIARLKDRLDLILDLIDDNEAQALAAWLNETAEHRQKMMKLRNKS